MNRIYKLVWNVRQGAFVAVAESARGRGKSGGRTSVLATAVASAVLALGATQALATDYLITQPQGSTLSLGTGDSVTIDGTGLNTGAITSGTAVSLNGGGSPILANFIHNSGTLNGTTGNAVYLRNSTLSGGLINSGTIQGLLTGIRLDNNSQVASGIANSGTVSAGREGILVSSGSVTGGITNSNLISGSSSGIKVNGSVDLISNSGTIMSVGTGIYITNGGVVGQVVNTGTITGGQGIQLSQGTISGGIVNQGTLQGNSGGIFLYAGSTISGGITNSGLIRGTSGSSYAAGIVLMSSATISGGITNSGRIDGTVSGINIKDGSTVQGGIQNTGTIAGGVDGIRLINGSTATNGITNSGLIQGGSGFGIAILDSSQVSGDIANLQGGTITGAIGIGLGNSLGFAGGPASTVTGNILNAGLINVSFSGIDLTTAGSNTTQMHVTGTIDNAGTIQGVSYGISLAHALVDGGITNRASGVIDAGTGIYLRNATVGQGVTNAGHILGGQGFEVSGNNTASIVNASTGVIDVRHEAINFSGGTTTGDIRNDGLIRAAATGIYFTGTTLVGGITNTGTVEGGYDSVSGTVPSGTYAGIYIYESNSITGEISNLHGTIVGSESGIVLGYGSTVDEGIQNSGTVSGVRGMGIQLTNSHLGGSIVNQSGGTITGGSDGIQLSQGTIDGGITNQSGGSITGGAIGVELKYSSTVSGGLHNRAAATISGGNDGLVVQSTSTVSGGISNAGLIQGQHDYGIRLSGSAISGGVANAGTGVIEGPLAGLSVAGTTISGGVSNSGRISAIGTTLPAYGVYIGQAASGGFYYGPDSSIQGGIANTGTIAASGSAGATGVFLAPGSSLEGISNAGVISGVTRSLDLNNTAGAFIIANSGTLSGDAAIGINTLDLNGGAARVIGNVTGSGGTVNVNGAFSSEGNFNVGTFNIADGGVFTMNHPVTVGGGHFNNAGILDVGTSAQSVTGNYTQAAGGAYRIGLSDTSSHYGKLVVSGNVSLSSGTTVDVRISGSPIIAGGTVVQGVITAGGSLTANPDSVVVTDNSRLYDFVASTARNGKQLDLIAIANPQAFAAAGGPDHPVTAGAATELQNLLNSGAPGMAAVFGKLDLMSAAQIPGAVQQMLPAVQGAVAQAGVSALHSMNKVIQSRIESNTGLSSGDAVPDNFLWGRVFGNEGRQEDIDGVSGFHSDTSGLVIGGDAPVTPKVRAGGAFTYASSRIKGNSDAAPSHVDVDTFEVVGYASYNIDPRTDINYQLDVGRNQARSHRDILFMGSAAQASFSSLSVHGSAGIGRLVPLSERTNITPSMRLDYTRMRTGAYQETGADALDLAVRAQVYREFLATGDVKFAHHLSDRLKLVGNGSAGYDFINQHTQTTSTFSGGGAAFVTNGLAVSPWVYRAGLGLVKDGSKGVEYSLRYDAEARTSGYLNQTLSAKVRWAL